MTRFHRAAIAAAIRHAIAGPGTGGGTISGNPYGANAVLGLHFDGDFSDVEGKIVSPSGVVLSSDTKRFGTESAHFNGSNSYISVPPSSAFDFGTGDWAIDMQAFFEATDSIRALISIRNGTSNPLVYGVYNGQFFLWNGNFIIQSGAPLIGEFQHLELSKTGGTIYLWKNGVLVASIATSAAFGGPAAPVYIGGDPNWGQYSAAFIDELWISKGKGGHVAPFTPPSAPY